MGNIAIDNVKFHSTPTPVPTPVPTRAPILAPTPALAPTFIWPNQNMVAIKFTRVGWEEVNPVTLDDKNFTRLSDMEGTQYMNCVFNQGLICPEIPYLNQGSKMWNPHGAVAQILKVYNVGNAVCATFWSP